MLKRLRIKFVCINMAIVTVILAVIFGLVIFSTRQNLAEQSIRMMQSVMAEPEEFSPPDQFGELNRPVRVRDEVLLPYFTLQEKDGVLSASGNTFVSTAIPTLWASVSSLPTPPVSRRR